MTSEDAAVVVRELEDAYAGAFNRRDAGALAALFTEDATIVTEWGDVVQGRAAFERGLAHAFTRLPGGLTLENTPAHTRVITEDVIVSHGTSRRAGAPGSRADTLVYTRVLARRGGEWRLAANHVAEPSSQPDPRASGG
jgi:uncharacterized protein (TIGR02246 family)